MPLDASFAQLPDQTLEVTLDGSLTLGTSLKMIEAQIKSSLAAGNRHVILNMAAVHYMDSAGLGLLVLTNAELANLGGTLLLRGVNQRIQDLLHLTRTDTLLTLEP